MGQWVQGGTSAQFSGLPWGRELGGRELGGQCLWLGNTGSGGTQVGQAAREQGEPGAAAPLA